MPDARDRRNYGSGRRLADYRTRLKLGERVTAAHGRGSKMTEQVCSGLSSFARYLREAGGPAYLEAVRAEHMIGWAQDLRLDVDAEEISRSTASTYVSAVNQVLRHVGRDDLITSAKALGLNRGQRWDNRDRSNSADAREEFRAFIADKAERSIGRDRIVLEGLGHSIACQESGGLRFRESCCAKLVGKDVASGTLQLSGREDRTKNARDRVTTLLDPVGVENARRFITDHRTIYARGSLIPGDMSWRQYRRWVYEQVASFRSVTCIPYRLHGNRHAFAQERFSRLWEERAGVRLEPPCKIGIYQHTWMLYAAERTGHTLKQTRSLDHDIRFCLPRVLRKCIFGHDGYPLYIFYFLPITFPTSGEKLVSSVTKFLPECHGPGIGMPGPIFFGYSGM